MKTAIAIICSIMLCGCVGTVTPHAVNAAAPSWDGKEQNSGLLNGGKPLADGNYELTPAARARYDALIPKYGKMFTVPIKADEGVTALAGGNFEIDPEHIADFARMNKQREKDALKK